MLDKKEREKLEEEYGRKLLELERTEVRLDGYYYKFERETAALMEKLSYAFKGVSYEPAWQHLSQIEDNLNQYHQQYKKRLDDVLEARYQENRRFQQKLDE
ncbi:hypothetical protein ACVRXQ_05105 [Streptococcus panodentis]|uniref:Uncharacterized protein n=1 Tax=Streptococcus panodentis TaxID=1581472 RepID=A0ABS5AWB6_9STRE|nr:hypothetical protein [Streptococcus panodentis]MBP2620879.1 hypothetical protein [Streptococcus panodentis]